MHAAGTSSCRLVAGLIPLSAGKAHCCLPQRSCFVFSTQATVGVASATAHYSTFVADKPEHIRPDAAAHQASAQNSTANSTTSASNTTSATNTTSNVTSTATQAAATSPTTTSTTSAAGIPACPNFLAGLKALKGYTTVLKAIEATKLTAQFSDPSYVITAFLPDDTVSQFARPLLSPLLM